LKIGVSTAITVDDTSVEKALFELEEYGIKAGPCGASVTAGLKALPNLGKGSVVLLFCTEGVRTYEMAPKDI
jgi:diaminopropionate ammonia-lyase